MIALTPEQVPHLVAAVVLAGVALVVLVARARDPLALGFSAFALGIALRYAGRNVLVAPDGILFPAPYFWVAASLEGLGAALLFVHFPRRLTRDDRAMAATALACGTAFAIGVEALSFLDDVEHYTRFGAIARAESPAWLLLGVLHTVARAALISAWFAFPLRARRLGPGDVSAARSLGILAIGVFLFYSGALSAMGASARGETHPLAALLVGAEFTLVFALWVRATRGHHPRIARNVVVAGAAIGLASLVLSESAGAYAWPLGSALGALLLGYAVLRGRIEGLDLKVRFALSKSTVAAVFVAVFFVASEAAQQFLGETTGSAYLGIAAAGALVFAIAPLQRVAERVAKAAVPDVEATPRSGLDPLALFRAAVELAMSDGAVTRGEERKLAQMAHDLGLTPLQAFEVRDAVERARDGGAARVEVVRE